MNCRVDGCNNVVRFPDQRVCEEHYESPGHSTKNFTGVKVFCATTAGARDKLGETVTSWMKENPKIVMVDKVVTQSSDNAYHAIAITLFYRD